jgi:hypothetical protein
MRSSAAQSMVSSLSESLLNTMIEELALEVVVEAHRKLCSGKLCLACASPASDLVATDGYDVLGCARNVTASAFINCSNCSQRISSTRYAPHLEKCMGRGGRGEHLPIFLLVFLGKKKKKKKKKKDLELALKLRLRWSWISVDLLRRTKSVKMMCTNQTRNCLKRRRERKRSQVRHKRRRCRRFHRFSNRHERCV